MDNSPIPGGTISLHSRFTSVKVKSVTADANGRFEMTNVAADEYSLEGEKTGFSISEVLDVGWNDKDVNVQMSPVITDNSLRAVASWGAFPQATPDVDLHVMFDADDFISCDVSFNWKDCRQAKLEEHWHEGGQFGGETITIRPIKAVYTLYLENKRGDLFSWSTRTRGEGMSEDIRQYWINRAHEHVYQATTQVQWERINYDTRTMAPGVVIGSMGSTVVDELGPPMTTAMRDDLNAVPFAGWATETSKMQIQLFSRDGRVANIAVPKIADIATLAKVLYQDEPYDGHAAYDGSYREESRYVRLFCIDYSGDQPQVYFVPKFSSTPPRQMTDCKLSNVAAPPPAPPFNFEDLWDF